jgi:ribose 1,5-bisphosphokinase PhnN
MATTDYRHMSGEELAQRLYEAGRSFAEEVRAQYDRENIRQAYEDYVRDIEPIRMELNRRGYAEDNS